MKSSPLSPFCRLLPAIALVTLAGCSLPSAKPDPTRYYLLSAPAPAMAPAAPAAHAVTVGLCRIELPVYLRSPAVVLRPGGTELRYAPEARWGEALGLGITRVLKESLRAQPAVRAVVAYPAPQAPTPDYEVAVSVLACEGLVGPASPRTRFAARWEVRSTAPGAAVLASGTYESPPAEWAEGDYAALTAKLGESVAALGQEIGAALAR